MRPGACRTRDGARVLTADLCDTSDELALLIKRAEHSVNARRLDEVVANDEAYDVLTYQLAMIGETCKKLADDLQVRHPHLLWHEMATFPNLASNDYLASMRNLSGRRQEACGRSRRW